jgi:hypothetical protein
MEAGAEVHAIYNTILLIQLPITLISLIQWYWLKPGLETLNSRWISSIDWVRSLLDLPRLHPLLFLLMSLSIFLLGMISFSLQLIFMYEWIHKREVQFSHTLNLFQQRIKQIFLGYGIDLLLGIVYLITYFIVFFLANFFGFKSELLLWIVSLLMVSYFRFALYPIIVEDKNSWEGFIEGIQTSHRNFLAVVFASLPLRVFESLFFLLFKWLLIFYPSLGSAFLLFNIMTTSLISPLVGMYFLLLYLKLKPGSSLSLQG